MSHKVIKRMGGKVLVGNVLSYLNGGAEYTSNAIKRYYSEEEKSCKIYEWAGDGIREIIEREGLENDVEKISYFSSRGRMGYDFTFSLGKDMSLLAMLDDRVAAEIREAVCKIILPHMAGDVLTRWTIDGEKQFLSAQALFQVYEHLTSRELDPDRHYHIFVPNAVLRPDGKLTGISAERMVANKFFYSVIANYHIAQKLQEMGYNAFLDKHGCVISSVDRELIWAFSKRRQAMMEKALELYGTSDLSKLSREQVQDLVLRTRREKENRDIEDLKGLWEEELKALGYGGYQDFLNSLKREYTKEITREQLDFVWRFTLIDLETRLGLFKRETLVQEFLIRLSQVSAQQNARLPDFQLIQSYLLEKEKDLAKTFCFDRTGLKTELVTTREYMEMEQTAYRTALALAEKSRPLAQSDEVEATIGKYEERKGFKLTSEQRNAVFNILCGAQLSVINGHAGAGKTTAAEIVADLGEAKGFSVVALAPTGKAAEELSKSLKCDGHTVDSFLLRYENGGLSLKPNTILFVDEAGMVDTHNLSRLIKVAEENGAKLVLQGDWKQLKPVNAGDLYTDIYSHLKAENNSALTELKTIRRQEKEEYREITTAYSEKDFRRAFQILLTNKDRYFERYEGTQAIKEEFLKDPKNTIITTATNREREQLNQEIRQALFSGPGTEITVRHELRSVAEITDLRAGDIFKEGRKSYVVTSVDVLTNRLTVRDESTQETKEVLFTDVFRKTFYREKTIDVNLGERVIALKNDRSLGLKNGEMFEVVAVEGSKLRLRNERKDLWVDTGKYGHFDYAYAITTHKAQGMTTNRVLVAGSKPLDYNLFYVAVTRGKKELKIYTNDVVDLLHRSQFPEQKRTTLNLGRKEEVEVLSRDEIARTLIEAQLREETWKEYARYVDDLRDRQELLKLIKEAERGEAREIPKEAQLAGSLEETLGEDLEEEEDINEGLGF
ncbi:MAG: MobF family relaxase [Candidatus Caldarchaeum sp.]